MGDIKIVVSFEQATLASSWEEHLCLHRTTDGKWCLDVRTYEPVGFAYQYTDEEGELPEKINGYDVIGTEDDAVVVDNLILHTDEYPIYEFKTFDGNDFDEQFGFNLAQLCDDETKRKIREAIVNYDR